MNILDFGVSYKDKIAVWKEDENSLSIHNTGPYTISQTPEGYVKVSWEETQYAYAFFLFEEITDTYAFIRLYGEWISESQYAKQDEEGRYYILYKMTPMTPQKEFDFQVPMISISRL